MVDKETCDIKQEYMQKSISKNEDKIQDHDSRLIDIEKVLERVVTLIEVLTKAETKEVESPNFWDTKKGDLLFKVLIVLGAAIIIMAFGMNINATDFLG